MVNLFDGIVWVDVVVWVGLGACMDSAFFVCWCSMAFAGGFGFAGLFSDGLGFGLWWVLGLSLVVWGWKYLRWHCCW